MLVPIFCKKFEELTLISCLTLSSTNVLLSSDTFERPVINTNVLWSLGLRWTKTRWRRKKMHVLLKEMCRDHSALVYLLKVRHPVRLNWVPQVQRCDKIEQVKFSSQNKVLLRSCKLAVDHGTAIDINAPYTGKQPLTRVTTNDFEIREIKFDVTWSYVKRQTAKMKLLTSVFSSLNSRVKIFVFVANSRRHFFNFMWFNEGLEEKSTNSEVIFAVCRLT